ncbi:MAG: hypothetical protein ABSE07_04240 [Methanoregula sp.]|jgi:hypothetical protein
MTNGSMPVWRGVLYMESPSLKWGLLNGTAVVYEYDVDARDNTHV